MINWDWEMDIYELYEKDEEFRRIFECMVKRESIRMPIVPNDDCEWCMIAVTKGLDGGDYK